MDIETVIHELANTREEVKHICEEKGFVFKEHEKVLEFIEPRVSALLDRAEALRLEVMELTGQIVELSRDKVLCYQEIGRLKVENLKLVEVDNRRVDAVFDKAYKEAREKRLAREQEGQQIQNGGMPQV